MPLRIFNTVLGYHPPSRSIYAVPLTDEDRPFELARDGAGPQTGEIATIQSPWDATFGDENPDDIVQRVGLRTYEKMLTEPTVKGGSRLKALGVVGPGWEVLPAASGERAAEEMADFIDWNFRQLPGPFKNVELGILSAVDYGFSNSEIKWGVVDEGEWSGKWALIDVKTKPPFSYGYKRDIYGNLEAITHKDWAGKVKEFDNFKKWVIYAHDVGSVFGNPYGRSQHRAGYDYWKALRLVFRMRGVFVERTASGIPLIRYKRGLRPGETARYEKMVRKIQTAAGMAVPEDVTLEWAEKKGDSHEEFEKFAVYCERAILRAMLIPSQIGIGPETTVGSMAKARVHQLIFDWVMNDADSDLTAVINEQLVQRMCDNNFPNAAQIGYPQWRHKERSSDDAIKLVAAYVKAAEGRGLGPVGLEDINTARRRLGHPEITQKEWEEFEAEREAKAEEFKKKLASGGGGDGEGDGEDDAVKEPEDAKKKPTPPGGTPGDADKVVEMARRPPRPSITQYRAEAAGIHANANLYRELTAPEKAAGLQPKKYTRALDKITDQATEGVVEAFELVREKLMPQLDRRGLLDGSAPEADLYTFGGVNGTAKKKLTTTMQSLLTTTYVAGAVTAKDELEKAAGRVFEFELFDGKSVVEFAELRPEFLIEPNEAREYWSRLIPWDTAQAAAYKAESFWITGLYLDDHGELLRGVQQTIQQGYKYGNWQAVEANVNRQFAEWVGSGELTAEGGLFTPWHAEVIVRNASMRGYNAGRARTFHEAREWIESHQWASIIDERTTDYCDGMDGVVFLPGQVEWPPAHHQCRSIVIAILKGMSYKLTDQADLNRLAGMRDATFTSGVILGAQ